MFLLKICQKSILKPYTAFKTYYISLADSNYSSFPFTINDIFKILKVVTIRVVVGNLTISFPLCPQLKDVLGQITKHLWILIHSHLWSMKFYWWSVSKVPSRSNTSYQKEKYSFVLKFCDSENTSQIKENFFHLWKPNENIWHCVGSIIYCFGKVIKSWKE